MLKMINIEYEKILFKNDLEEFKCSIQGKKLASMLFKNVDIKELENAIDEYYSARNNNCLTYDDLEELENAKNCDKYFAKLYSELN